MNITDKCVLCERCVAECPVSAISIPKGSNKAVIDKDICVQCGYCATICPSQAIVED